VKKIDGVFDDVCRVFNDATWMKTTQDTGTYCTDALPGGGGLSIVADENSICIRFSC